MLLAQKGNQSFARTKGGLNSKLHLVVDAHGLQVKMIITGGNTADCAQAIAIIDGLIVGYFMSDKAYDTNVLLEWLRTPAQKQKNPSRQNVNSLQLCYGYTN